MHPTLLLVISILLTCLNSAIGRMDLIVCTEVIGLICLVCLHRYKRAFSLGLIFLICVTAYQWMIIHMNSRLFMNLSMVIFIFIRICPSIHFVSILMYDTKTNQLISALNQLHIPKNLILGITVALNFIPSIRQEVQWIRQAQRLRGIYFSKRNPMQAFEYVFVPVLYRVQILSEQKTIAALTRGVQAPQKRSTYETLQLSKVDIFTLISILISLWRFL